MPIGEDVLQPIPGPNSGGENLRYAAVYDKIKEARREDDDAPQGEWQRERKKADWVLVLKLSLDALTTKSKDLQIAVWATEALVHRESFAGLRQGLDLLRKLLSNFWDTLYPELEDGEADLRAAPLEWVGSRLEDTLKSVALTRNGLGWFKYKESRGIAYETDVGESEAKRQARESGIAEGKMTPEEFDEGLRATPKAFYQQLATDIDGCLTALEELKQVSDEKLHDLSPTYSNLRDTLEVIRQAVGTLLQKKREQEPDEEPSEQPAEAAGGEEIAVAETGGAGAAAAPARAPIKKAGLGKPPSSTEEAHEQVLGLAQYLRTAQPCNPVPYLLVRGLRWGELRAQSSVNAELLVPPASELRQQLKRLAADAQWQELLEAAENTAGLPCGRGWLDVHRYAVQACRELGSDYEAVASAISAGLKSLLADYPDLARSSFADDTPVANAETQTWLEQLAPPAAPPGIAEVHMDEASPVAGGEAEAELPPDAFELAKQALQSRRAEEAVEILTREIMQERCGRARFQRRIQLAQICMSAGYEAVACPILEGLAQEIEQRKLEEWESPDLIAQSLALLFHCWQKLDRPAEHKEKLYAQICRLDPTQGLQLVR